jgi:hypothetical protein
MEYIVDIIEQQMSARGWSRLHLSRVSGVKPTTVSAVFNRIHSGHFPQLDTLGKLVGALGLELRIVDPKTNRAIRKTA